MAETYGVYDWRALPLKTAATLAQGLPAQSRVVKAASNTDMPAIDITLLAIIADRLGQIAWMLSEDGSKGKNRPPSLLEVLSGKKTPEPEGFDSGEDFMAAWSAITGGEGDA